MLRYLVEKLGMDIYRKYIAVEHLWDDRTLHKHDGALYVLASGKFWWQAAEGIPYLISQGANLDLRDVFGRTPLWRALEQNGAAGKRAARVLIEAGADVSVTDDSGQTCLALAGSDLDLAKRLLDRGAELTASAIFSAIDKANAELLDVLCQRASPDARIPLDEFLPGLEKWSWSHLFDQHEMYPLYFAAGELSRRFRGTIVHGITRDEVLGHCVPSIEVLMRRGANPLVPFTKRNMPVHLRDSNYHYEKDATLLHELLEDGGLVAPIFELSEPNLEHRDAHGRTLLLAASRSRNGPDASMDAFIFENGPERPKRPAQNLITDKPSAIELFLNRGAFVAAQDDEGKNALHHILQTKKRGGSRSLRRLITAAPELVHQVDHAGETPLHYALRRHDHDYGLDTEAIELLFDAGADVFLADKDGNTALHSIGMWLAEEPREGVDKLLLLHSLFRRWVSLGLPINGRNSKGETPMLSFLASQGTDRRQKYADDDDKRQRAALDLLIEAGADVHTANNEGDTLLHIVASTNK